ncbi:WhiB family transcriptional regulator [Kitasatospora mediocidica]|uniref:WhiB family transcriptional regulator n=1 Tax=Kitasatospora mediocidica TaxID=58352 RepID=UPI0022B56F77|nr:WhiB family transcriptional regulator [Kitasatospora mediocidica]
MSTVITPPLPSVPSTAPTKADPAPLPPPEGSLMQITALDDTEALGSPIPCRAFDPEVFFAETPADVEYAKSLCGTCPVKEACLAGALDRREPWGVWGGELFVQGVVVARKRPRGRPRKTEVAA